MKNKFYDRLKEREIPEITESYGLSALEVDRINRNTKSLDKEERAIHRRLMPKQKTKTIPISELGNYLNGGYYKSSTGHLKDF